MPHFYSAATMALGNSEWRFAAGNGRQEVIYLEELAVKMKFN